MFYGHIERGVGWRLAFSVSRVCTCTVNGNKDDPLDADVLGGEALMRALEQCKEVLMIPNTSYENLGSYVWRPESEVDLSSLAPSMNQSELLSWIAYLWLGTPQKGL